MIGSAAQPPFQKFQIRPIYLTVFEGKGLHDSGNVLCGTRFKYLGILGLQDSGAETGEQGVVHAFLEGAKGIVRGLAKK